MEYTHIFFDLDGTLSDPKIGITRSVQYALKKFGIEIENLDHLTPFIGPPLSESFAKFFNLDTELIPKAIEYYREYFKVTGMFENILYPNMRELLKDLKEAGKILTIATSKPTVFAEQIAAYFDIAHYFSHIVGSNLDGTRVDKDEVLEYALQLYPTVAKNQCIMIGDRKFDIESAHKWGLDSVAVTYGYGSKAEIVTAKPTYRVDTIDELRAIVFA